MENSWNLEFSQISLAFILRKICWLDTLVTHNETDNLPITRRQNNLYRMYFAHFSVNFERILMKFCKDHFQVMRRLPWDFHWTICIATTKLDHGWKQILIMSPTPYTEVGTCWFTFVRSVHCHVRLSSGIHCAVAGRTSKHETLIQCWANVSPPSTTRSQH